VRVWDGGCDLARLRETHVRRLEGAEVGAVLVWVEARHLVAVSCVRETPYIYIIRFYICMYMYIYIYIYIYHVWYERQTSPVDDISTPRVGSAPGSRLLLIHIYIRTGIHIYTYTYIYIRTRIHVYTYTYKYLAGARHLDSEGGVGAGQPLERELRHLHAHVRQLLVIEFRGWGSV